MKKTLKQRIDDNLIEMEQLQKLQSDLLAQFKEQERKARTHRLCKRGGLMEKAMPELITLTDKQFDTFMEKVVLTHYGRKILAELTAENEAPADPQDGNNTAQEGGTAAPKPAQTAAQVNTAPAQKPAGTVPSGGSGNASWSNSAGQPR